MMILLIQRDICHWQVLEHRDHVIEEGYAAELEAAKDAAWAAYKRLSEERVQAVYSMLSADDEFMGRNTENKQESA